MKLDGLNKESIAEVFCYKRRQIAPKSDKAEVVNLFQKAD